MSDTVCSAGTPSGAAATGATSPLRVDKAWEEFSQHYSQLALVISGQDVDVVVSENPVNAVSSAREGRIVLGSNEFPDLPQYLDLRLEVHRLALTKVHGHFLHDLAHVMYTGWDNQTLDPLRARIASLLEDLRVEHRMVANRPSSRPYLRAGAARQVDETVSRFVGPLPTTLLYGAAVVGRAVLGVLEFEDVGDAVSDLEAAFGPDGVREIVDVLNTLKVVGDADGSSMLRLTDRLAALLAQPGEGDETGDGESDPSKKSEKGDPKEKSEKEKSEKEKSEKEKSEKDDSDEGDSEKDDSDESDSEEGEAGDGEPSDGEPSDGEPGESSDGEPGESSDGEPSDGEPSDGEPSDGEPSDGEPSDGEPGESSDATGDSEGATPGDAESKPLSENELQDLAKKFSEAAKKAAKELEEKPSGETSDSDDEDLEPSDADLESLADALSGAEAKEYAKKLREKPKSTRLDDFEEPEWDPDTDLPTEGGSSGYGYGGGLYTSTRDPKGNERVLRQRLTNRLRKARHRDRSVTEVSSMLPPGRLSTREAVLQSAQKAQGRMPTAKPWRTKHHRFVESPVVRMGILCDVSGSMSSVVGAVASTMWVSASSMVDTGGISVGIAFGDTADVIVEKSYKAPEKVTTFPANGGSEAIYDALLLADDRLDLYNRETRSLSARILVIVSDGHWVDDYQRRNGDAELVKLIRAGVKVIHVGVGSRPSPHPGTITTVLRNPQSMDRVIGESCEQALRKL